MPKVKENYLQDKKNQILNAAFAVCNRKPTYDVTMSDIVSETGMSQGGVYKYFNNIDSVFSALIDRANSQNNYGKQIDEVLNSDHLPDVKLRNLFLISEQYFSKMLISYNKILFELGTFFAHNPKRRERINQNVTTVSTFGYLTQCAFKIISSGIEIGYFTPVMPVEHIFSFIIATYDGIIRDVTLSKCYPDKAVPEKEIDFDEKKLIECLYISTMTLLGRSPRG